MLNRIILFSINNKLTIGLLTCALILWGSYCVKTLSIDAVPEITNNQVQIITIAPSQSALDIERLVTFPVEQNVATISNISEIRSLSRFGLSIVTIVFKENIDVYWARQQVNERLTEIQSQIPAGIGSPKMAPITTGLGEIYQYVVFPLPGYEKKYSLMDLRTIQDWIVRRQLLGTEGVADVSSYGGELKQYEIALNSFKLKSFGISFNDIFVALEKNNQNTGGAYIEKNANAYFIRSKGLIENLADIENIVLKTTTTGDPILLRNVAKVQFGHATRYGAMTYSGHGEVTGAVVMMLKGANSAEVIKNVKDRIENIKKILPEGVGIKPFLDRSKLVSRTIKTVTQNLAEGALIVLFVLVVLLGNVRAGFIVASVIPLSMLFAISMMKLFGVSGNLMSLGAIDFGLIVDGAVIIVEATLHHLGIRSLEKKLTQQEMNDEVYQSTIKMSKSATFGGIIILIVYLPILTLAGIEGKMFKPMAQTVSFALIGAFILALTYVPMISSIFLNTGGKLSSGISEKIMGFLYKIYSKIIHWAIGHIAIVLSSAVTLFVISILIFRTLGAEFIPTLDEGDFAVETRLMVGSSLSEMIMTASTASDILVKNFPDEVKEVVSKIGSSEIPIDPMPLEACDLIVVLHDKDNWTKAKGRAELAEKMKQALEVLPQVSFGFQQPIQMRFNELMTGARQDVIVKVYGESLEELAEYAKSIAKLINTVKGAKDLYVESVGGLPQILININRDKIASFGLDISTVNQAINIAFSGQSAGLVFEEEKRFDLVVRLEKAERISIEDVRQLYITTPSGEQIPLSEVAEVNLQIGPNQVQRDDAKRRITIGFNVRGSDVQSIVLELKKKIEESIVFQPGYYTTYGGAFKNLEEARSRLTIAVPVALALIIILLFFTFKSLTQCFLIFTGIPLSVIGGILALWLRSMPFSVSAGVGFIALFGVSVLNGIVLISEFNSLKKKGDKTISQIVFSGTKTRLRPVLMTAAVASLGFLPMAISNGDGAEVQRSLATVVIGGLVSSTFLTLIVLPCLYYLIYNYQFKKMKTIYTISIILLLKVVPFSSQGQSIITMEDAILRTKANNQGLKVASLEVELQKQLKKSSTEIPKTSLSLMLGQYNSLQQDNNLTITQNLPFPGVFTGQKKLANSLIESSNWKRATTQNEIIFQVRQTYLMLQFLDARHRLLGRQDSIYNELVRIATIQYRVGEGTLLQKTSAEAKFNEILILIKQNESKTKVFENQLQVLLNLPEPVSIADKALLPLDLTLDIATEQTSRNPLLGYQFSLTDVASKERKVLINKTLPEFNVGYFSQTLIGTQISKDGIERHFGSNYRFNGFIVGISIPLWFYPNHSRIKSATIAEEKARIDALYFQNQLKGQWQKEVENYSNLKSSLDYYTQSALPNARLILQQSKLAYEKGEISQAELRLNLQQVIQIEEGHLQALIEFNQSVISLEFLSGIYSNN